MKVSVMEYVRERKLIYATREILNGNKILDVAIEYGWESHSEFIKAFKSYYGFHLSHAPFSSSVANRSYRY